VAIVIVAIVIAAVLAIGVVITLRNRSAHSSVDSFRRQIDALGPAARRNVVDQVQNATEPDNDSGEGEGEGGGRGT
jgi:hypothetical protein